MVCRSFKIVGGFCAKAGGGGEEAAKDRDQESLKYDNILLLVRSKRFVISCLSDLYSSM